MCGSFPTDRHKQWVVGVCLVSVVVMSSSVVTCCGGDVFWHLLQCVVLKLSVCVGCSHGCNNTAANCN